MIAVAPVLPRCGFTTGHGGKCPVVARDRVGAPAYSSLILGPPASRDILRPMGFRERVLAGTLGIGRFGPLQGSMRVVRDHADLEALRAGCRGFIVNIRDQESKLHRVTCDSVEVMHTGAYPKVFSETAAEAAEWVKTDIDKLPWTHCGLWGGAR